MGCFGSTLAYEPNGSVCLSCPSKAECGALVEARHPTVLKLLERFGDGKGGTMDKAWRRRIKLAHTAVQAPTMSNKFAHQTFQRMVNAGFNPYTDPLDHLATASRSMHVILACLGQRACTPEELTRCVVAGCKLTKRSATNQVGANIQILVVCDRAQRDGTNVEIK